MNVANLGRRPYRSLSADVTWILQDRLGFLLRGEIIWQKAHGAGGSCAWRSFRAAGESGASGADLSGSSCPVKSTSISREPPRRQGLDDPSRSRSTRTSSWRPRRTSGTSHREQAKPSRVTQAPFPVKLPAAPHQPPAPTKVIWSSIPSWVPGPLPCLAVRTDRRYVGYDTDEGYVASRSAGGSRTSANRGVESARWFAPAVARRCTIR